VKEYSIITFLVVFTGIFLTSMYNLGSIWLDYRAMNAVNEELRDIYLGERMSHNGVELLTINWEELQSRNEDVVAWVYLPGTRVNHPILEGMDNYEYLHLDINREQSNAGSIFLEENNSSTFEDLNTIIYGHNMLDRTMFSDIDSMARGNIGVDEAPYVHIYLPNGTVNIYRIVSANMTTIHSDIYYLPVTDLGAFYDLMLEGSVFNVAF